MRLRQLFENHFSHAAVSDDSNIHFDVPLFLYRAIGLLGAKFVSIVQVTAEPFFNT